ncbi:MAG: metallophosphoesterase [Rhodobacter sp.]|nr:metallophosphoesterase [Rhodobacter sp.]MCY4169007.1 metallophosphoesterase [Rhodobacter sp.]
MRIYAIGDIHGQADMLRAAHERIATDRAACGDPTAEVIHLGDFCDRGPNTAGVIQILVDGVAAGEPWRMLLGNHDRLFRGFVRNASVRDNVLHRDFTWMSCALGGETTLRSYGLFDINGHSAKRIQARLLELIPGSHITFLEKLESMVEYDELAFVHAGILPGVSLSRQLEDDLVWIRDEFLLDTGDHGKLIVHGHSAIHSPTHYGNRVNLDTGAGYFRRLTVAVFEDRDCWALTDLGREKLEPSPHMVGKVRNPI